ncbi:cell division protein CrgA [Paeniglutamicibacter gangotriensis]|uniref:cell division protein CrgA n=1 Tax=Paeniglutamicibacter gangotriensis TaxID=254787 RepID=UPI0037C745DC
MPESKTRRKNPKPQGGGGAGAAAYDKPLPKWYKPVMFGLMLLGLVWIITYYISQTLFPIPGIGGWNIVIGFGVAMVGFFMTTGWR